MNTMFSGIQGFESNSSQIVVNFNSFLIRFQQNHGFDSVVICIMRSLPTERSNALRMRSRLMCRMGGNGADVEILLICFLGKI